MTLEDHLGDVFRKARLMMDVPPEASAASARLTATELATLEETGVAPALIDWAGVATRLDLSAPKLKRLAEGWTPAEADLSTWREVRRITTEADGMSVHCYLVWDEVTREAALFDTGFDATPIFALLDSEQLNLQYLFITHTHGDHVAAAEPILGRYPKLKMRTGAKTAPPQHRTRANEFLHLGSLRITHRDTPGHAEDGITYVIGTFPDDAPNVAIVGDAIFAGSMGGAPGKGPAAKTQIREQILTLPGPTLICPGHGPMTTVAEEKSANPFFP